MTFYEWYKDLENRFEGLKDNLEMSDSDMYSTLNSFEFDVTGATSSRDYHNSKTENRVISLEEKRVKYYKALNILGDIYFSLTELMYNHNLIPGTNFKIYQSIRLIQRTLAGESKDSIRKDLKIKIKEYPIVERAGLQVLKDILISKGYRADFKI